MEGWTQVRKGRIAHPTAPHTTGTLVRCDRTGRYVLLVYGIIVSVPQNWAKLVKD